MRRGHPAKEDLTEKHCLSTACPTSVELGHQEIGLLRKLKAVSL